MLCVGVQVLTGGAITFCSVGDSFKVLWTKSGAERTDEWVQEWGLMGRTDSVSVCTNE
jgi:hypothetical protein